MTWHVEQRAWLAYVEGRLDPAEESSVEMHVAACARCRDDARDYVPPSTTDEVWGEVRATISAPTLRPWLRPLRRLGVRSGDLVVVSAAESLVVPWVVAVGLAVACACLVGLAGLGPLNQDTVFLAMAPLIPVLAVVASYDAMDALREIAAPTPYSKLRVALLRATAALTVAVPVTALIGLVPGMNDLTVAWMLPALGLTSTALTLLTWFDAAVTAVMVATTWLGTVALLRVGERIDVLSSSGAQAVFAAMAVAVVAVLVLRTSTVRLEGDTL